MDWWVAREFNYWGMAGVGAWVFWVLLSISLHELAHGWAAIWEGDDTPIAQERMTLNPLVQMGSASLFVFALIGIAWGAMPVNPYRFRHRKYGDAIVSAAGPAMNLILALISGLGLAITLRYVLGIPAGIYPDEARYYLGIAKDFPAESWKKSLVLFFYTGFYLNAVLLILNLLPIPPLDGSRILACFSRRADQLYRNPEVANYSIMVLLAVFFLLGQYLWDAGQFLSGQYVGLIRAIIG